MVDIRVDKDGTIIYAAVGRGTTIADNSLLQRCVDAVKNSRVSAVENSDEQRGNVVFVFKRH